MKLIFEPNIGKIVKPKIDKGETMAMYVDFGITHDVMKSS